eukprot:6076008-Lingulodinium_polyedra.AAC.1
MGPKRPKARTEAIDPCDVADILQFHLQEHGVQKIDFGKYRNSTGIHCAELMTWHGACSRFIARCPSALIAWEKP